MTRILTSLLMGAASLALITAPGLTQDLSGDHFARLSAEVFSAQSQTVLVAAHRAAHNDAPENSILAIEHAIALGVDIVELDVKVTCDGVPVLMHDETVDATTDGSGRIEDMTFAQVRALRLKARKGDDPDIPLTDHRVPSLQEALRVAKGRIFVDLDLKTSRMAAVVNTVNAVEFGSQALWFDSDWDNFNLALSQGEATFLMPRARSLEDVEAICARFPQAIAIHIDPSFYTVEVVNTIRACDARIWINALGDVDEAILAGHGAEALNPLLIGGANIIQTDQPAAVLAYLRQINRHW